MSAQNHLDLSPKWQARFNFFDRHGAPATAEFKQNWKTLPFGQRFKIRMNLFALFFGWIYFFVLGLWRKGLVLVALTLVMGIIASLLPDGALFTALVRGVGIGYALLVATSANYAYYLDRVKGSRSWNPFEG